MSVVLVDCRPHAAYEAGHVPGAVHLDPERDLTGEIGDARRGRHPLPEPAALAQAFTRAGIGARTQVLAYDEGTGWAARCWWLLRHLGHDAAGTFDLRTYAGPLAAGDMPWGLTPGGSTQHGRHGRTGTPGGQSPGQVPFVPRVRTDDVIEADEILARLDDPALVLWDARAPERWRGDAEPLDPVAGRIPGARSAPFEQPLPVDATAAPEIAAYCGSGVTACVTVQRLVLAGRPDARLYPGSFSEWCRDPRFPIERGDP